MASAYAARPASSAFAVVVVLPRVRRVRAFLSRAWALLVERNETQGNNTHHNIAKSSDNLRSLTKSVEINRTIRHHVVMEDELLTVEEASKRVKMHPVTVRRLLRDGQLPGRKVGVRQWRVSAAALKAYIEGGAPSPAPEKKGKR